MNKAIATSTPKEPRRKRVARERYQDFLHADSGMSFIEWLRARRDRERARRFDFAAAYPGMSDAC